MQKTSVLVSIHCQNPGYSKQSGKNDFTNWGGSYQQSFWQQQFHGLQSLERGAGGEMLCMWCVCVLNNITQDFTSSKLTDI